MHRLFSGLKFMHLVSADIHITVLYVTIYTAEYYPTHLSSLLLYPYSKRLAVLSCQALVGGLLSDVEGNTPTTAPLGYQKCCFRPVFAISL